MPDTAAPSYRFVPAADRLERLFALYEQARHAAGIGATLQRVSPGQRIDAIVVMLGLNAAAGWRRIGEESAESLWLRHLTPVLAETREAAAALASAVAQCLPGTFEPPIGYTPHTEPGPRLPEPPAPAAQPAAWRRKLSLWTEEARRLLLDRRTIAGIVLLATAAAVAVVLLRPAQDDVAGTESGTGVETVVYEGPGSGSGGGTGSGSSPNETSDQANRYREALALTLGTAQQGNREITPRELARAYAGESDMQPEPAVFLSAMLREWPLPADLPIPRDASGQWALQLYAAAFVGVETGTPIAGPLPEFQGSSGRDRRLQQALASFSDGVQAGAEPRIATPETWPAWLRWLVFLPLLPVLGWSIATFVPAVQANLVNAARKATGIQAFLPVDAMAVQTALPPERRLGRQIGWSEPVGGRRLHGERSVRATIRRGGYLTPVVRMKQQSAAYVFLVPRRHRDDHERDRASRLIEALERGGVPLDVYDYDPDPRWLQARAVRSSMEHAGTPATGAERRPAVQKLDLRGLRERHPDARLVLVTDGAELVDYFTRRPHPFVSEELATWPMRVLLTPTPLEEWGEREMNLADALGAPVGRATVEGFRSLAKAFGERRANLPRPVPIPASAGPADMVARLVNWLSASAGFAGHRDTVPARPHLLRFDDPALTSDAEPPAEEREALVAALRGWLGPAGFQWLAACAAYPKLHFAVTLYLGLAMTVRLGPVSRPVYDEALLAQLTLLPWFRTGRMPPWLRRTLFAALPDGQRDRARAAVDRMLNESREATRTELPIWRPERGGLDVPPDAVMAELMMRDVSDVTPVLRGEAFSRLFGSPARRALLLRAGLVAGTALWCLAAYWFWPAPEAAPHPNGAWLPLIVFAALTVLLAVPAAALGRRFAKG